jgi:3-methyl-2-oxobutanoate hydroxymethyltransferase
LSQEITKTIKIPTIGIGSSKYCDGQILVTDDILGLTNSKMKFVKKYTNLKKNIRNAVKKFQTDVKNGSYPSIKYSY